MAGGGTQTGRHALRTGQERPRLYSTAIAQSLSQGHRSTYRAPLGHGYFRPAACGQNEGSAQGTSGTFETRLIQKRYTALLEGELETDEGIIDLPICPNPMDRPRQMVSREYGKRAITSYRVLERKDGRTRVTFYPHTGRTHQLRVHAAHPEGLNHPMVGDDLYGQPSDRLYLHAAALEFVHPVTGEKLHIVKEADF